MGLTSVPLIAVLALVTVSLPWLLLALWRRSARSSRRAAALLVVGVMLAQASAIATVAVGVNKAFGFFPTWGALFGHPPPIPRLSSPPARPADARVRSEPAGDHGRFVAYTFVGDRSKVRAAVRVWLPPQYSDAAFAADRFPVVTVLGPAYLSVGAFVGELDFGRIAAGEIRSGRVPPFLAVFPEINVQLPVDTECTDIPGGSQGYTWLAHDVPAWAERTLRVRPLGDAWAVAGYSTGGYCAAKLHLRLPSTYAAAASIEGYFRPELDGTTGNLKAVLASNPALAAANSPEELIKGRAGSSAAATTRVLVMTSRDDPQSYDASMRFVDRARGLPDVRLYLVPGVGHSFAVARGVLPSTLQWLADHDRAGPGGRVGSSRAGR